MNKIKQNIAYILCAALGFLTFVFSAFAYVAIDGGLSITGYNLLGDYWEMCSDMVGVATVVVVFHITILVVAALMCAYGICGILKGAGKFSQFPESFGSVKATAIAKIALAVLAVLNFLQLIFLIITVASDELEYSGFKLSGGIFFALIFSIVAFVACVLTEKKNIEAEASAEASDEE